MNKGQIIGLLMASLVFFLLGYTCYQYIVTIQASQMSDRQQWYENVNSVVALILCIVSLICYSSIMLTPANPLPLNKDKLNGKTLDEAFQFPKIYHKPSASETHEIERAVALSISDEKGYPLYCYKCKSNKPERTHHCKVCNRCAAKMDHHCLWYVAFSSTKLTLFFADYNNFSNVYYEPRINGCVDNTNYKRFALFVFYVACYALWVLLTTAPLLLQVIRDRAGGVTLVFCWKLYKVYLASIFYVWKNLYIMIRYRKQMSLFGGVPSLGLDLSFHWYSVIMLALLFGILLTGFSAVHFYYIFYNLTSIEYIATRPLFIRVDYDDSGNDFEVVSVPSQNIYNLGLYKNWCSVMGNNPLLWFVPSQTEKNSAGFEKLHAYDLKFEEKVCHLAKLQRIERTKAFEFAEEEQRIT